MPATKTGKQKTRRNAFRHGLRATDELFLDFLKPRERKILADLRQVLHAEYNPQREQEKLLVDRIAIQHFRLFRLYQLEYEAERRSRNLLSRESVLLHLDRFSRYDQRLDRQLRALHNRLKQLYLKRGDFSLTFLPVRE